MNLEFDAATHRYRLDGQPVPGVTSITDTLIDFGGIAPSVLEAARDRGTAVHLMCQYVDEGGVDESSLDPALLGYLAAYRRFLLDTGVIWTDIEQRVCSRLYRYAGTLDRVGALPQVRKTRRVLVDIKAVAQIQPAVGPQTAAYTQAYRETFPRHPTIQARFALQLKPDGSYKFHECREESDLSVFIAAKTIHEWRARHA